jgi:nucleotide-binding universal stress UspA family protein
MSQVGERRRAEEASVMVAFDGSEEAQRALLHAAAITGPTRSVTVVNVIPAQSVSSRLQTVTDKERKEQRRLLQEARQLLARHGVEANLVEAVGDPLTEILAAAERAGASTLVVGRRARRGALRGSLGDRLIRRATCDVLIVH